jgi:hypothetical protein
MEKEPMSNSRHVLSVLFIGLLLLLSTVFPLPAGSSSWSQTNSSAVLGATQEILGEVSQLRGLKALRPVKAHLQSRADIERSLIRDVDEKTTPEEFDTEVKALHLLGLVPRGFKLREFLIKLLTEQIAGYYRPKTKTLYLADWLALDEQRPVMAHELMHALQDQHFGLQRFENPLKGEGDKDLAIHALVEGEATAVMVNYLLKPHHLDITHIPVPLSKLYEELQNSNDERSELLRTAPAALRETLLFPYIGGTQFVQYLLTHASWSRISEAYSNAPDSTEQILHPDRFLTRDEPTVIKLARLETILGNGWKRRLFDVNGEFGYFLILSEYIDKETARRAADGWDGDQLVLYENVKDGALLLAHRSTWDAANEAQEFTGAYMERIKRRYAEVEELRAKPGLAAVWTTSEGLAYVERRAKDVLVIETAGRVDETMLQNVARALWKSQH